MCSCLPCSAWFWPIPCACTIWRAALFFGGGGNRALFPVAQQTLERRPVIILAAQSPARRALAHACRRGPFHPASLADPRLFRRRAARHPPLVLDAFGRSTLWFPINLLWLPALGFIVLPLSFLGLIAAAAGLESGSRFPAPSGRTFLARRFCIACAGCKRTRAGSVRIPSPALDRHPWLRRDRRGTGHAHTSIISHTRRTPSDLRCAPAFRRAVALGPRLL